MHVLMPNEWYVRMSWDSWFMKLRMRSSIVLDKTCHLPQLYDYRMDCSVICCLGFKEDHIEASEAGGRQRLPELPQQINHPAYCLFASKILTSTRTYIWSKFYFKMVLTWILLCLYGSKTIYNSRIAENISRETPGITKIQNMKRGCGQTS